MKAQNARSSMQQWTFSKVKKMILFKLGFTVIGILIVNIDAQAQVFPKDAWGVYTWGTYHQSRVNRQLTPHVKGAPLILKWSDLEPANGHYEFDKLIRRPLEQFAKEGYCASLMVWVAFATLNVTEEDTTWKFTPPWIFQNGVPLVAFPETVNPLGHVTRRYFPYYFDEDYKFYFHRMISSLGEYILNLPEDLRSRIIFVQSAEGSTGDGSPYKGEPLDAQYAISKEQWSAFRIETWEKMVEAFSLDGELQIPLLTNYDSNREIEYNWMLEKLPKAIGLKNGMFSHGYHISEAQKRLADFESFRQQVEATGKAFFARGEQDAEYKVYGWSTRNMPQGFYWSALYATHCGLTMWNVPWEACSNRKNFPALELFNHYAAQTDPKEADYAFCALRRGLDASDVSCFPESTYGKAEKSNTTRYQKITDAFSEFGAQMGDVDKAVGGGMQNRKRMDYNDAGWKILPGNYQRHLYQLDPEETSIAWWSVDSSIYGRFARGFDHAAGKNALFFDLEDQFFGEHADDEKSGVKVKIIYYEGDAGSWKLLYHAADGSMKKAYYHQNSGKSKWSKITVELDDALLNNGGEKGADLVLSNAGSTNCRFHLIEVDKNNVRYNKK